MINKSHIPSLISLSRLIFAPIIFYTFLNGEPIASLVLFVIASFTDFLDGYIARKMNSQSDNGAFVDVVADFVLITICFSAFILKGFYDPLVMILIILMFVLFIATSTIKKPIYDPVGKYLGAYLMLMIFITFLFPEFKIIIIMQFIFVLVCISSIISRIIFLHKSKN